MCVAVYCVCMCVYVLCNNLCVCVCLYRADEGAEAGVPEAGGPAPRGEEEQHHRGEEAGV